MHYSYVFLCVIYINVLRKIYVYIYIDISCMIPSIGMIYFCIVGYMMTSRMFIMMSCYLLCTWHSFHWWFLLSDVIDDSPLMDIMIHDSYSCPWWLLLWDTGYSDSCHDSWFQLMDLWRWGKLKEKNWCSELWQVIPSHGQCAVYGTVDVSNIPLPHNMIARTSEKSFQPKKNPTNQPLGFKSPRLLTHCLNLVGFFPTQLAVTSRFPWLS